MSTRAELRAKVKPLIGGRTDKDSVINDGLEEGLKRAMDVHPFKTRQVETDKSIAENDTTVDLPDDTLDLIEVRLIDGTASWPIFIKEKKWLVERWPNISEVTANKPVYGYVEGDKIHLYPISNGSYTVRMTTKVKPSFSGVDATENPIPSIEFALICFATAYAFRSVQLFDFAVPWDTQFVNALATAIPADKRSPVVKRFEPFGEKPLPIIDSPSVDPITGIASETLDW